MDGSVVNALARGFSRGVMLGFGVYREPLREPPVNIAQVVKNVMGAMEMRYATVDPELVERSTARRESLMTAAVAWLAVSCALALLGFVSTIATYAALAGVAVAFVCALRSRHHGAAAREALADALDVHLTGMSYIAGHWVGEATLHSVPLVVVTASDMSHGWTFHSSNPLRS